MTTYTIPEVAEILMCPENSVRHYCDAKRLRSERIAGTKDHRIDHNDLLAFMSEREYPIADIMKLQERETGPTAINTGTFLADVFLKEIADLCEKHQMMLMPLDNGGMKVIRAIPAVREYVAQSRVFLEEIPRWQQSNNCKRRSG